jgi:hypothetical protein
MNPHIDPLWNPNGLQRGPLKQFMENNKTKTYVKGKKNTKQCNLDVVGVVVLVVVVIVVVVVAVVIEE